MKLILGTDIGGTFTDTVFMNDAGEISIFKVPSTPQDNSKGVIASIGSASQTMGLCLDEFLAKVDTFFHGIQGRIYHHQRLWGYFTYDEGLPDP